MKLPIDNIEDYPVFYRFYRNAKIYGAKITLREYSKEVEGMIISPGFFFKPVINGVKADLITHKRKENDEKSI